MLFWFVFFVLWSKDQRLAKVSSFADAIRSGLVFDWLGSWRDYRSSAGHHGRSSSNCQSLEPTKPQPFLQEFSYCLIWGSVCKSKASCISGWKDWESLRNWSAGVSLEGIWLPGENSIVGRIDSCPCLRLWMHGWKLPARNLDQVLWFLWICHWPFRISVRTEFLRRDTNVLLGRREHQPSWSGTHGSWNLRSGRILGRLLRAPHFVVTTISLQARCRN